VSESKFEELKADNRIWWGRGGDGIPAQKRFLSEVR
jgi:adenine-specific DNA-methyltransferase